MSNAKWPRHSPWWFHLVIGLMATGLLFVAYRVLFATRQPGPSEVSASTPEGSRTSEAQAIDAIWQNPNWNKDGTLVGAAAQAAIRDPLFSFGAPEDGIRVALRCAFGPRKQQVSMIVAAENVTSEPIVMDARPPSMNGCALVLETAQGERVEDNAWVDQFYRLRLAGGEVRIWTFPVWHAWVSRRAGTSWTLRWRLGKALSPALTIRHGDVQVLVESLDGSSLRFPLDGIRERQSLPFPAVKRVLDRVAALQQTARAANAGALGCGVGSVTVVTSRGEVQLQTSLDAIRVFGPVIKIADIHILLTSRAETIHTGKQGPMSGDVSDLCYVCLSVLSEAQDPVSVSIIEPLLYDSHEATRGWAAIALIRLSEADPELKERIQRIEFPKAALNDARARSTTVPAWVLER